MKKFICLVMSGLVLFSSCGPEEESTPDVQDPVVEVVEDPKVETPDFNADSAYAFIQNQVDFGFRIPNTPAHDSCGEWIKEKLTEYGFELNVQKGVVTAWTGEKLNMQNIMGQFNPDETNRILLAAHWDSRPYADNDTVDRNKPIVGANDGGSGVGVLLEIARQVSLVNPNTGVDILFFDAEDMGAMENEGTFGSVNQQMNTWCLGSQYWTQNQPFDTYYKPRYGILLDMVGAKDATFPKEGVSQYFAAPQVNRIWKEAEHLGYGDYFVKKIAPQITDDHTYVNQNTSIKMLDIIHYAPADNGNYAFGHFHHTHKDNMDIISTETLKAVGQTVLHVVYQKI